MAMKEVSTEALGKGVTRREGGDGGEDGSKSNWEVEGDAALLAALINLVAGFTIPVMAAYAQSGTYSPERILPSQH